MSTSTQFPVLLFYNAFAKYNGCRIILMRTKFRQPTSYQTYSECPEGNLKIYLYQVKV